MKYGFVKVAAAVPHVQVGQCRYNAERIVTLAEQAADAGAAIVAVPELSLTGYTCGDLFGQRVLLDEADRAMGLLVERTAKLPILCVTGMPLAVDGKLYNAAVVWGNGKIYGAVPKRYLPNYNEFYEARWFAPGADADRTEAVVAGCRVPFGPDLLFEGKGVTFGIEVCEDLWVPMPPSSMQALAGAQLLINLSASDEMVGKHHYLQGLVAQQSARTVAAYLYCAAGVGESSTDLVFAGCGMVAENGILLAESERFATEEQLLLAEVDVDRLDGIRRRTSTFRYDGKIPPFRRLPVECRPDDESEPVLRQFDPWPFVPQEIARVDERCTEIFNIQVAGLAQRLRHTRARTAVVGISGGLDSTLALLVTVRAFDRLGWTRDRIVGVTMPGFGTTDRTYTNAINLMRALRVTVREISIRAACEQHFADIGFDAAERGVTYENAQARERTQILMDVANQTGGLVIGTGDLSELALGWATYNGDHMSMYGVNAGVPKTLVQHLVRWVAMNGEDENARRWLLDIVATPISPELLPPDEKGQIAQRTEDLVGPYELHDFFLYHFVRFGTRPAKLHWMACRAFDGKYDAGTIKRWLIVFLRRFFAQQFKRSALPDGPKVGSVSLSPRGDWRMPSDAVAELWIAEAENL